MKKLVPGTMLVNFATRRNGEQRIGSESHMCVPGLAPFPPPPHPRCIAGQQLPWLPSFPVLPELRHPRGHRTPWNLQQTFRRTSRLHHPSLGVVLERMVSRCRRDTNLPGRVRFLASRHRKWDRAAAAAAGTKWRRETG